MSCCCKTDPSNKSSVSCLGRCDLPKHKCMKKDEVKPGPVPKNMGWQYTSRTSPEHQLRCGWRPGHIACPVLKKIDKHNCVRLGGCSFCPSVCCYQPCVKPCCMPTKCTPVYPVPSETATSDTPKKPPTIRITRHGGKYTITTDPSKNCPSSAYPLKYVINQDRDDEPKRERDEKKKDEKTKDDKTKDPKKKDDKTKDDKAREETTRESNEEPEEVKIRYSVEGKFNDTQFDYTSSQSSFVVDFTPPM